MWSFEGSGDSVKFSESDNGRFQIYGSLLRQSCQPQAGDTSYLDVVNNVTSLFFNVDLADPDEPDEVAFDSVTNSRLLGRFQAKPSRSHAKIEYLYEDKRSSMISVSVLLRKKSAQRVFEMYKLIFSRCDLFHLICVEFLGMLPKRHAEVDLVSVEDFLNRDILDHKPHFSDSVSFSFHAASRLSSK
jgi:hypothetical protein